MTQILDLPVQKSRTLSSCPRYLKDASKNRYFRAPSVASPVCSKFFAPLPSETKNTPATSLGEFYFLGSIKLVLPKRDHP
jgi:hypothetical protein